MLFRKNIPKSCSLCLHSAKLGAGYALCTYKGVRPEESCCLRFRYDPCKRIPVKAKALDFSKYDQEDYSL